MNFKHWIGFCIAELFRKIDFRGFMSWKTQPNCRAFDDRRPVGPRFNSWQVPRLISGRPDLSWLSSRWTTGCPTFSCQSFFFKIATALVIILFGPLTGLFINLTMCIRALFHKFAPTLGLLEQAFWRVPPFTEWIGASSLKVIVAGPSRHSTAGASGSRSTSPNLLHEKIRRRIW